MSRALVEIQPSGGQDIHVCEEGNSVWGPLITFAVNFFHSNDKNHLDISESARVPSL